MKKSIFGKIGAAAVVLTLVTGSLVGGTFAKYVTNKSGSVTASVASWNVKFSSINSTDDFATAIPLVGTGESNTILPGDQGSVEIKVDGSTAQVGFNYKITVEAGKDQTFNALKFYTDDNYTTELTADGYTGSIAYSGEANKMEKTIKLYWKLPNGATDDDDTAMAGKKAEFTINMHAEQSTTPAPSDAS